MPIVPVNGTPRDQATGALAVAGIADRDYGHAGTFNLTTPLPGLSYASAVGLANTMRVGRVYLSRPMTIQHALINIIVGAGTDDQYAVVIYNSAGQLLASAVAGGGVAPAITSAGQKVLALGPVTLQPNTAYYVGILYGAVGTTAASFSSIFVAANSYAVFGTAPPDVEADQSTQTFPPPATITFSGAAGTTLINLNAVILKET